MHKIDHRKTLKHSYRDRTVSWILPFAGFLMVSTNGVSLLQIVIAATLKEMPWDP